MCSSLHVHVCVGQTEPCRILSTSLFLDSTRVSIYVRFHFTSTDNIIHVYMYMYSLLKFDYYVSLGEQKKREEFYRERGEVDPSELAYKCTCICMYNI